MKACYNIDVSWEDNQSTCVSSALHKCAVLKQPGVRSTSILQLFCSTGGPTLTTVRSVNTLQVQERGADKRESEKSTVCYR